MHSYKYLAMIFLCSALRGTISRPLTELLEHSEPYLHKGASSHTLSASLVTEPKWLREQAMRSTYPTNQKAGSKGLVTKQTEVRDAGESNFRSNSNNVLPKHGGVFEIESGEHFAPAWHDVENEPYSDEGTDQYKSYQSRAHASNSPPTSPRSYFLSLGSSYKARDALNAREASVSEDSGKLDHKGAIRINPRGDSKFLNTVWA